MSLFEMAPGESSVPNRDTDPRRPPLRGYHDCLPQLVDMLRSDGLLACLLVDAEPRDPRRCASEDERLGPRPTLDQVLACLRTAGRGADTLLCAQGHAGGLLAFVRWPRGVAAAEQRRLAVLVARVERELNQMLAEQCGQPAAIRSPFAVGQGWALHSPPLAPEMVVERCVDAARQSAELSHQRHLLHLTERLEEMVLCQLIRPAVQPVVDLSSGAIYGYESLARGPSVGPLGSPAAMFTAAETVGLEVELDCTCMRAAFAAARSMPDGARLFVNLLPESLHAAALLHRQLDLLTREVGLSPSRIVLEITESRPLDWSSGLSRTLTELRRRGFALAIDDVGTGHANLEALLRLQPEFLKASIVLTRHVADHPVHLEMIRSLQAIAGKTDAELICEGIETLSDLRALQQLGIRFGQGYLLARPAAPFPTLSSAVQQLLRPCATSRVRAVHSAHVDALGGGAEAGR